MDYERISSQPHISLETLCEKVMNKYTFHQLFKSLNFVFMETDKNLPPGAVIIINNDETVNVLVDNIIIGKNVNYTTGMKIFTMYIRVFNIQTNAKGKLKQILEY